MKLKFKPFYLLLIIFFMFASNVNGVEKIKSPGEFFGFRPGTDRMLFDYEQLIKYFKILDKSSPKIVLEKTGNSPMGKPIFIAFISSEKNIKNLPNLKKVNRRLALDPGIPDEERKEILKDTPVSFLATLSMHSGEVGPSQAAPLIAYDLITSAKKEIIKWLDDVVFLMVPNHNPDGMNMVVHHYWKYKGKKYEGSYLPGVYHKYVGHDNNRDFVTLTQTDTKAIASIYNLEWFPQVMVEKHQMGSNTSRYYVPPNHDPIAENIDAGIWNWSGIFGANMIKDMTRDHLAGVSQHYLFDDYWPGSTETCIWKNVIGFLTEAASVKYATPVYIEQNELRGYGKGLAEYEKSINMPLPWDGGWWKLSDIINYEISSTYSILKTSSKHREDILRFRNELCKREVERGRTIPPYYYILPLDQADQSELVSLVNLLHEHGIKTYNLKNNVESGEWVFKKGDIVVPLEQPFRPFIKEVMESQKYPVRHYTPGGKIIKPYDITSWSLPLHKGVKSYEIIKPSDHIKKALVENTVKFSIRNVPEGKYSHFIFPVSGNESYKVAFLAEKAGIVVQRTGSDISDGNRVYSKGSFIIKNSGSTKLKKLLDSLNVSPGYINIDKSTDFSEFKIPRIGLVETWFHDMDAGWTRFVLDSYSIPFTVIRPSDIPDLNLERKFDVIIFPDARASVLKKGKYKSGSDYFSPSYPPEYAEGMGKNGFNKILSFIDNGGIIVSWGASTGLFMGEHEMKKITGESESFSLPVRDISAGVKKKGLYCPGSFVKMKLKQGHPLTLGMGEDCGIFFRANALFRTNTPVFDMDRRVIGKFPKGKILLSGYCENEEVLRNTSAMVWLKKNKGQLVLMGFSPQFRASTEGTFKLLFNSILLNKLNR
ncbi:MAG: M14 family zinc carboxypeptidase [Acidobacteriota bacterium]